MQSVGRALAYATLLATGCADPMQRACYETARTLVEEAQVLVVVPCEHRPEAQP